MHPNVIKVSTQASRYKEYEISLIILSTPIVWDLRFILPWFSAACFNGTVCHTLDFKMQLGLYWSQLKAMGSIYHALPSQLALYTLAGMGFEL